MRWKLSRPTFLIRAQDLLNSLIYKNHIWDGAATLAFYTLFALLPALLVFVVLLSQLGELWLIQESSYWWRLYLPPPIYKIFQEIMMTVAKQKSSGSLVSLGFFMIIWAMSSGVAGVIRQLNIIHQRVETRHFLHVRLIGLFLTLLLGVVVVISVLTMGLTQFLLQNWVDLQWITPFSATLLSVFNGVVGAGVFFLCFSFLYAWGPNCRLRLSETWAGSLLATVVFMISSQLYTLYLTYGVDLDETYGGLAAGVGLLLWLYILNWILLTGAQLNQILLVRSKS